MVVGLADFKKLNNMNSLSLFFVAFGAFASGVVMCALFGGVFQRLKIDRLKNENKMLVDRNNVCSENLVVITAKYHHFRDKSYRTKSELNEWRSLADEVARHPQPPNTPVMISLADKGIQLLNYYKSIQP